MQTGKERCLLDQIQKPGDVKKLEFLELPKLCKEIRRRLITVIAKNGGHLASNLGVVELTVAMHRVFDCPHDRFVFDVGHQCYTHKLLTGRREQFPTLRQQSGISGFPKRCESEYDGFIAGHSGTSISAALGFARAKKLQNQSGKVLAVIGDGSFSGLAFEAINTIDESLGNIVIILNDNGMSISKNVSPMGNHLARIRNTGGYYTFKDEVERLVKAIPFVGKRAKRAISSVKGAAKNMLYHSNMFEEMGLCYLGPVDGHSLPELCATLNRAKSLSRPVLVHVKTQKGKGYRQAEENPGAFHGVGKFDPNHPQSNVFSTDSFSERFGMALTGLAKSDQKIVAITAAMKYATGLHHFAHAFPEEGRFFDVGIAEGHGVIFGAAMAAAGQLPVFAVYSSFLQRAYDQLIHDCALEPAHLVLAVDRAGFVGEDGETHQGLFDVAFFSTVPGGVIYSPATYECLERCLFRALYNESGPVAVRYPRGAMRWTLPERLERQQDYCLWGEGETLVITYGRMIGNVMEAIAAGKTPCKTLLLERIFPIPEGAVLEAMSHKRVLFVEEGAKTGGLGEQFGMKLLERGFPGKYRVQAANHAIVPQGNLEQCFQYTGLSVEALVRLIEDRE